MLRLAAALFIVVLALAFGGARVGHAQTPMVTKFESLEGKVQDQAPSILACSTTSQLASERLWIAQGRLRSAYGLGAMDRKFIEDRTFALSNYAENAEKVMSVEVDHVNKRLYTLTERGLYRQSIATPSAPGTEVFFDLFPNSGPILHYDPLGISHTGPVFEAVRDLRVWGTASKVMILTSKRILIFNDGGGSTNATLTLTSWTQDLDATVESSQFPLVTCAGTGIDNFNARGVRFLHRMRVMEDSNGKIMAYVLAEATSYQVPIRPRPLILMLCHLDDINWTKPTFDSDPSLGGVNYAWWDPMPTNFNIASDWMAVDLDVAIEASGARFVYLACGKLNQVQKVTVTAGFPRACPTNTQLPSVKIPLETDEQDLRNILVDQSNPVRFAAIARTKLYIHQAGLTPSNFAQADEVFSLGCPGDLVQVSIIANDPSTELLYTLCGGVLGHVSKVIDITSNNSTPANALLKVFGIWGSDGAVAIGDTVVLPTFSGVVKFDRTGPNSWRVDPPSFKTTEDLTVPQVAFVSRFKGTEHVDLANIPSQSPSIRVVTASVGGGFDEFPFVTTPPVALLSKIPHQPNGTLWPAMWSYPAGPVYGNDIAFFDMGGVAGDQVILTDLTHSLVAGGPPSHDYARKAALLVWRWNPTAPVGWVNTLFAETYSYNSGLVGAGIPLQDTIDVVNSGSKWFAFVSTGECFYSAELTALNTSAPSITLKTSILCDPLSLAKVRCGGASAVKDRLFVFVNSHNSGGYHPPELRTYTWNTTTGIINTTPIDVQVLANATLTHPLNGLLSGYRMRYDITNTTTGAGDLYIATDSGTGKKSVLLKYNWDGTNPLSLAKYWSSDYEDAMQDCRIYTLTTGEKVVLAVKDRESFAILIP